MSKIKMQCAACGSENVRADAYAEWDFDRQEWTLSATFDKGAVCEDCGGECSIEEVAAPDPVPDSNRLPDTATAGELYSPDGTLIVGTLETLPGTAYIGNATRQPDDSLSFEYEGGSDVDWDGQRTVKRDGQRVFVDIDGEEWLESQLSIGAPE